MWKQKLQKIEKTQSQCSEISVFIRIVFLPNNYKPRERHITKGRKKRSPTAAISKTLFEQNVIVYIIVIQYRAWIVKYYKLRTQHFISTEGILPDQHTIEESSINVKKL